MPRGAVLSGVGAAAVVRVAAPHRRQEAERVLLARAHHERVVDKPDEGAHVALPTRKLGGRLDAARALGVAPCASGVVRVLPPRLREPARQEAREVREVEATVVHAAEQRRGDGAWLGLGLGLG